MSRWSADPATAAREKELWLAEDNEKIVICDIVHYNTTPQVDGLRVGYFSNFPYITGMNENNTGFDTFTDLLGNTVSNIPYDDILINIPNIISRIDSDVNIGAIEFLNADGAYDELITYAWEGHPIQIFIGARDWIRDDFIIILEAVSTAISSPRPNIMSLGIRDKKEVFNVKAQLQLIDEDYVSSIYSNYSSSHNGEEPFIKDLENLISRSTPIEIKIDANITIAELAKYTQLELDKIPEISATESSGTITLTQELLGDYWGAHDGYESGSDANRQNSFDTNFAFLYQDSAVKISVAAQTIAVDNVDNLEDTYFQIYTPYKQYYIWYNVSNTSVDPELINWDPQVFNPSVVTVPETILNSPVPICLGKCFNIEPKLIDANNHIYQVHEGTIDSILNVRSNGIRLAAPSDQGVVPQYEVNLEIGCFRLLVHDNNTQMTCDVIGQNSRGTDSEGFGTGIDMQMHSAAMMVEWLALEKTTLLKDDICTHTFGLPLVPTDPDFPGFGNSDPLGVYIKDEAQISALVTDIMASVGGFSRFHRTCILQIFRFEDPETKPSELLIDESSILEKGLSLSSTEVPKSSIILGGDKNWTVQDKGAIAALVSEDHTGTLLDLYTDEYTNAAATNLNIKAIYPLAEDSDLIGTFISDFVDRTSNTQKEADRRKAIRATKRYTYKVQSTVAPFTINIGDVITLQHKRFGFNFGRKCLVIGMEEKPTQQRINIEVWL